MNQKNYVSFCESENGIYRDGQLIPFAESHMGSGEHTDSTLIVTCFNRAHTIREAIESALRCSRDKGSMDILVVDDGSTDGSVDILRDFARQQLIKFVALAKNSGSEALPKNIAAFLANSDYLSYLDSDDRIGEPDAFDTSLSALQNNPEFVMSVSNLVFEINCTHAELAANMPWLLDVDTYEPNSIIKNSAAIEYRRRIAKEHSVYELLNHGYYDAFKLMRREAFLQSGGVVEDMGSCGDFGTYLRLNRFGRCLAIPRDFYVYVINGENDSFYSDEKRQWLEAQHRAFALGEIRHRGLKYKELLAHCEPEFAARYKFTPEEVEG